MAGRWTFCMTLFGACGPDVHYETVQQDAQRMCENRSSCSQVPNPVDTTERCVNAVFDESEIGLDEGARCANSFSNLLTCLSLLSCDQFQLAWSNNYSIQNNPADFPCKAEITALFRYCDKTWYAVNE